MLLLPLLMLLPQNGELMLLLKILPWDYIPLTLPLLLELDPNKIGMELQEPLEPLKLNQMLKLLMPNTPELISKPQK